MAAGLPILPRTDKVRYEEIAADLRKHYESSRTRNVEEAEFRLAHLDGFFARRQVAAIGGAEITAHCHAAAEGGSGERHDQSRNWRH